MLIKVANSEFIINASVSPEDALSSPQITARFQKIASEIKKISPRSGDFLYFIARGIHAMEHAAIDPVSRQYNPKIGHVAIDSGNGTCQTCNVELIKGAGGQPISGLWCKSSTVDPWINQNGDAFPEIELLAEVTDPQDSTRTIKAYQSFIGKGLFTDHKSSEVENIRGIILDAEYDHASKGVDLLIALDKVNYPELARQVSAGYSTQVSMGTQVNYSLCSACGNKAVTENDYCSHVRNDKALVRAGQPRVYEVNSGLNFIEISMVGNAADPRARIRQIVAHANNIKNSVTANLETNGPQTENQLILDSINRLEQQVNDIQAQFEDSPKETTNEAESNTSIILNKIASLEKQINEIGGRFMAQKPQNKKAYMQGTVEPDVGNTFEMADKNYTEYWDQDTKQSGPDQTNGPDGMHGGYGLGSDEDVKKMYYRANMKDRRKARKALLEKAAYMQGTVEPEVGTTFEMADKNYTQYWDDDIKQSGPDQTNGPDGMHGGYGLGTDEQVKKDLLRAKLRAKLEKSANPAKNKWTIFAGNEPILEAVAEEVYGSELDAVATEIDDSTTHQEWFDSKNYGINLIQAVKTLGVEKVAAEINRAKTVTAQAAPAAPMATPAPAEQAAPEAGAPPAPEAPAEEPELEGEDAAPEMTAGEGIREAAERIETAKDEILGLVDELDPQASAEGAELAGEMGEAGEELGELGQEMGAAEELPPAAAKAYKKLTRQALDHADKILKKAEAFVVKYAEEDEEEEKSECEECKEMECKCEKTEASLNAKQLKLRREARRAYAQQLYNLTEGDMIAEAHPEGGNETTFPGQPEGKIETETEAQEDDEEVANSIPTGELTARKKYRNRLITAAERIVTADAAEIATKAKEVEDAEETAKQKKKELVDATTTASTKTAEADNEAKQYYKELASTSATGNSSDPETTKFYTELTQDFGKKTSTAAIHDYGLKMKRAYAVALKRANLGQIEATQEAIEADVDRLTALDDSSFSAFSAIVENTKKAPVQVTQTAKNTQQVKTAGALRVGVGQEQKAPFADLNSLPWST